MTETLDPLPQTFRSGSAGGCAVLLGAIVGVPVFGGLYAGLTSGLGLDADSAVTRLAVVALVCFAALYWFFGAATVVTVDRYQLTVARQSSLGPLRGRLIRDYELPWGRVDEVLDLEQRSPGKRGVVKVSFKLVAGERALPSTLFGTGRRDGKYLAFLEAVRAAVGDKLVRHEDQDELEVPLRPAVEQLMAEREGGDGSSGASSERPPRG
jgi:hypothetical protein